MSPTKRILNVFKQALVTFPARTAASPEIFNKHFSKLKTFVDQITREDVKFDDNLLEGSDLKGPCTYIQVYEDVNVHISIFVIRPGHKMPLHDHPNMHGLLKVIAGSARIQSYSKNIDLTSKLLKTTPSAEGEKLLIALKSGTVESNEKSETCILTPEQNNFHEIEPIGGPAAFLDILSPPYDADIPDIGTRECKYYKVGDEVKPENVQLIEIPQPRWFWCESAPYMGSHLMYKL